MANTTQGVIADGDGTRSAAPTMPALSAWKTLFAGIEHASGHATRAIGLPTVERRQDVNVLRIDLRQAGLDFVTTLKGSVSSPLPGNGQTIGDDVYGFMGKDGQIAVAIDANYSVCKHQHFKKGIQYGVIGLAVSRGEMVSNPQEWVYSPNDGHETVQSPSVPSESYAGAMALVIRKVEDGYTASFETATAAQALPANIHTAIAGSPQPKGGDGLVPTRHELGPDELMLVPGYVRRHGPEEHPPEMVAARTAVGVSVSASKRFLYLLTIDGIENNPQPYGAGYYDLACWLAEAGATSGINLDGGGSTVMARRGHPGSPPVLINTPHGDEKSTNSVRPVSLYFGITAPLA